MTIVEQLPVPLGRALGDAMGKACGSLHARHNVTLRCGVEVIAITDGCVFLGDGSTLGADIVVVGIGTIPNTEWLANPSNHPSNPAPDAPGDPVLDIANGIAVDEYCRALSPSGKVIDGVYAVGDVARFPLVWPVSVAGDSARVPEFVRIEHWTNAAEMGAHVGEVMTGAPSPFQSVPYFWSDQYNHKIQFLGRATSFDEVRIVGGSVEEGAWLALYRVGDRLTAALGVSKIRALAPYRRLLAEGASWQKALDAAPQS